MKTTKELLEELKDRPVSWLVWAMTWRFVVAYTLIMVGLVLLDSIT